MSDGSGSTSWTIDPRGRTTQEIKTISGSGSFKTNWSYNSADLVSSLTYRSDNSSGSGEVVNIGYNIRMLVNSVGGTNTYVQSTTYDPASRVEDRNLNGTLVTDYVYYAWTTQGGRLSTITSGTTGDSDSIQNFTYAYDAWGNITTINDYVAGNPQIQTFTYDNLNRLLSAQASGGFGGNGNYGAESYTYSTSTGNLASKTGMGN